MTSFETPSSIYAWFRQIQPSDKCRQDSSLKLTQASISSLYQPNSYLYHDWFNWSITWNFKKYTITTTVGVSAYHSVQKVDTKCSVQNKARLPVQCWWIYVQTKNIVTEFTEQFTGKMYIYAEKNLNSEISLHGNSVGMRTRAINRLNSLSMHCWHMNSAQSCYPHGSNLLSIPDKDKRDGRVTNQYHDSIPEKNQPQFSDMIKARKKNWERLSNL